MRKYLFAGVAALALAFVAAAPSKAQASWLSEALHAFAGDRGYYGYNYPYGSGYGSPYYSNVPGYYVAPDYYSTPGYYYSAPSYYGPGYYNTPGVTIQFGTGYPYNSGYWDRGYYGGGYRHYGNVYRGGGRGGWRHR